MVGGSTTIQRGFLKMIARVSMMLARLENAWQSHALVALGCLLLGVGSLFLLLTPDTVAADPRTDPNVPIQDLILCNPNFSDKIDLYVGVLECCHLGLVVSGCRGFLVPDVGKFVAALEPPDLTGCVCDMNGDRRFDLADWSLMQGSFTGP